MEVLQQRKMIPDGFNHTRRKKDCKNEYIDMQTYMNSNCENNR